MNHDVLFDALIVAAVPAMIAAGAAIVAARISSKNRARLETGNGKTIGGTVHDLAQQQEIQAAIQHTNSREVVQLSEKVVRVEDKMDTWIEASKGVHDEMLERLRLS